MARPHIVLLKKADSRRQRETVSTEQAMMIAEFGNQVQAQIQAGVTQSGIGIGAALAIVLSWQRNKSILLAIIHGVFSWFYVVYFALSRRESER